MDIISPQLARITAEPFYRPVRNEHALFEAAFEHRLPVLLKGPTGCGTTRFVESMAWKLNRPLVTVACDDDLTAATSSSVGRWSGWTGRSRSRSGPARSATWTRLSRPARTPWWCDKEARDYLPHLYGAAHYTVVDDVARLPYKVADIYRNLTH